MASELQSQSNQVEYWDGKTEYEKAHGLLRDINDWIKSLENLPEFVDGPIINVPLDDKQKKVIDAQLHTLKGIRDEIKERFGIR